MTHSGTVSAFSLKDAQGQALSFALYLPSNGQPPYPTVILSHGFGGRYPQVTDAYARYLSEQGFLTLAFNFRVDGKEDMLDTSVLTEAATLHAVIDQVKARPDADVSRLFLMGESQGGFVSTHVAAARTDVRGLVLLYPAYVLQYDAWVRHPEVGGEPFDPVRFDPASLDLSKITAPRDVIAALGIPVSTVCSVDALRFNIYREMRSFPGPVLLLHGTADPVVPLSYSERAADPSTGFPHARLVPVPEAGHGFTGAAWDMAARESTAFLRALIAPRP